MEAVFSHLILRVLEERLKHLTWYCTGCPKIRECEEQPNGGEPRFCWPIIDAAILGAETWETDHWPDKIKDKLQGEI